MNRRFGFIIDTNQYTGDFHRQLCAFITGHVGECGRGKNEKEDYLENYAPQKNIAHKEDEYGFLRPGNIYRTDEIYNNGLGFHYREGEEEIALAKYKEYVQREKNEQIQRIEGYRGQNEPNWSEETINKEIARLEEELRYAMEKKKVDKYPAYQSVIIYLEREPFQDQVAFFKQRAYEYENYRGKGLKITGFRFLEEKREEQYKAI